MSVLISDQLAHFLERLAVSMPAAIGSSMAADRAIPSSFTESVYSLSSSIPHRPRMLGMICRERAQEVLKAEIQLSGRQLEACVHQVIISLVRHDRSTACSRSIVYPSETRRFVTIYMASLKVCSSPQTLTRATLLPSRKVPGHVRFARWSSLRKHANSSSEHHPHGIRLHHPQTD